MSRSDSTTDVLTIRVPKALARRLAREARRLRTTRSEVARSILVSGLQDADPVDPKTEARRQSLIARGREAEREAIQLITDVADLRGWE